MLCSIQNEGQELPQVLVALTDELSKPERICTEGVFRISPVHDKVSRLKKYVCIMNSFNYYTLLLV